MVQNYLIGPLLLMVESAHVYWVIIVLFKLFVLESLFYFFELLEIYFLLLVCIIYLILQMFHILGLKKSFYKAIFLLVKIFIFSSS